jgi:hypothetical protein
MKFSLEPLDVLGLAELHANEVGVHDREALYI